MRPRPVALRRQMLQKWAVKRRLFSPSSVWTGRRASSRAGAPRRLQPVHSSFSRYARHAGAVACLRRGETHAAASRKAHVKDEHAADALKSFVKYLEERKGSMNAGAAAEMAKKEGADLFEQFRVRRQSAHPRPLPHPPNSAHAAAGARVLVR